MSNPQQTSTFEANLNALELVTMQTGYNLCVNDLEKVLHDSVNAASTTEELRLILNIQTLIHQMGLVRFPSVTSKN